MLRSGARAKPSARSRSASYGSTGSSTDAARRKAKSYLSDDLVVVMLRGGFTAAESTLLEGGRGDSVIQQRAEFQEVMGDRFREVVEQELGRKVVATMAAVHQHPDLLSQIFVLEATELLTD
jgi:uncharacterized protein YbcI